MQKPGKLSVEMTAGPRIPRPPSQLSKRVT